MRIDCETHIGKHEGEKYTALGGDIDARQIENLMGEVDLDMCVVMAPTTDFPDNRGLAAAIKGHPRLVGFAVVNPHGPGGGVPELERAVHEWGMKGVKLQPIRHAFDADSKAPLRLMECAERLGIPVTIHSGSQNCLPWQIGHLARKFPTVPVVMNHMGFRYYVEGAINVAMETPNIYFDTALVSIPGYINMAVSKIGAERVIYGSDYPNGHPSVMISAIKTAQLTPEAEKLVMGDTLARLLKLK